MPEFGGQPYFQGPIETTSRIMLPEYGLLDPNQLGGPSKQSSGSGGGYEMPEVEGLKGESLSYLNSLNNINHQERTIKNQMYQKYIDTGGKIPKEEMEQYYDTIVQLNQGKTQLAAIEGDLKKRRDTGYKTKDALRGNLDSPIANTTGEFMTAGNIRQKYGKDVLPDLYEDDRVLSGNDVAYLIDNLPNVPEELLSYSAPDMKAFEATARGVFKDVKSSSFGQKEKAQAMFAIMNDEDPSEVLQQIGGAITGEDNKEQLNSALKDFKSSIAINTDFRRAYNYGSAQYKAQYPDSTAEDYFNDVIAPKANKQRSRKEKAESFALNASNRAKTTDDKFTTYREKLYYGDDIVKRSVTGVDLSSTSIQKTSADERTDIRSLFKGDMSVDDFSKKHNGYNPDDVSDYHSNYTTIKNEYDRNMNTAKSQEEKDALKSGFNSDLLKLEQSFTIKKEISDEDMVKHIEYNYTQDNTVRFHGSNDTKSLKVTPHQAMVGTKAITQVNRTIEYAPIPEALQDQYNSLAKGHALPKGTKVKAPGSDVFIDFTEYEGLESAISLGAQIVYYDIDDLNNEAIAVDIQLKASDALRFLEGNNITIPSLDDGELSYKTKTLLEAAKDGNNDHVLIQNFDIDDEKVIITGNEYYNKDGALVSGDDVVIRMLVLEDATMLQGDMVVLSAKRRKEAEQGRSESNETYSNPNN